MRPDLPLEQYSYLQMVKQLDGVRAWLNEISVHMSSGSRFQKTVRIVADLCSQQGKDIHVDSFGDKPLC